MKGEMKYFCSLCFSKNPSMIAFDASKFLKGHSQPLPLPSGSILQVTSTTKATPIPHPVDPVVKHVCKKCTFETETHEQLVKHEKETHAINCNKCGKTLTTNSERDEHVAKAHIPAGSKCTKCDQTFNRKPKLAEYIEQCHNNSILFICTVCDMSFQTQKELEAHVELNPNTKCPLCHLSFTDSAVFSKHITDVHAPTCSICDMKFNEKIELEKHIEANHSKDSPHVCNICDECFTSEDSHKLQMTEKHNLKCPTCEDTFPDEHMEATHQIKYILCDFSAKMQSEIEEHPKKASILA